MTTIRLLVASLALAAISQGAAAAAGSTPAPSVAGAASTQALSASAASTTASGETPAAAPAAGQVSALVARLTRGMTAVKTFTAPNGMIGVVAKATDPQGNTKPIMMYADPQGRMVIYGLGFDLTKNALLGAEEVKAAFGASTGSLPMPAAANPSADSANAGAIARLQQAAYIETKGVSKGGPTVYAFIEPNCSWCQRAVPAMLSAQRTPGTPLSGATVRWIPLAFSDEATEQDVTALDASGDGRTRITQLFAPTKPFDVQTRPSAQRVAANVKLFQALGDTGTPTFYVQRAGEKGARRVEGWGGIESFAQ